MQISDLVFIDSAGYHVADYPTFLSWLQGQYQGIYGADVYLGSDSQDGQFLAVLAQAFFDTANVGASVFNSFSPVTGQGVGLSRNVKINGLSRRVPTNSTVTLTIVGTAGTTILNGAATDSLKQKWNLPASVTIPGGGTIDVTATADLPGAVSAAASTITNIVTPTRGWQTVNNGADATLGAPVETDAQLRIRQQQSTANPSLTVLEGTYGAVANVAGVENVAVWENETNSDDGNSQPAHSILVVVQGGALPDIAQAIQIHKTPGTFPWSGPTVMGHNQSQTVYDSRGMPITIGFFQPPQAAVIGVKVFITQGPGWTADFEATIANQIAAYINGLGIGAGQQTGGEIRVIPLYSLVYVPGYVPNMYVVTAVQTQLNGGGFGTSDLGIDFTHLPSCDPTLITGDVVFVVV